MANIDDLKIMIRETEYPAFTDAEITFYLEQNSDDLKATAYQCLMLKAEDTSLQISGFKSNDSSKYFKRLAQMYRPSNSGVLGGG